VEAAPRREGGGRNETQLPEGAVSSHGLNSVPVKARIVGLVVERVGIGMEGLRVHLRVDGLVGLVRELDTRQLESAA